MLLEPQDLQLFLRLHRTLLFFVNQRLKVVADGIASPQEYAALAPTARMKVHEALVNHLELIESFVRDNPAHLAEEELAIVASWRHLVFDKFYIFRELKKYTVFLTSGQPAIAYGVVALAQSFEELLGPSRPVMAEAILLPFKGRIVYDGLLNTFRISFGPGIRRSLNENFKEAKERHGIVTSLPMSEEPLPAKAPKARAVPKPPSREEKDEVVQVIIEMIDRFCKEQLNDEYALVCRKLAEKLARKRPSPLLQGSPNSWASGIVRTVGAVNFLSDKTQTPTMRLADIDAWFGIGESTGAAKTAAIRKLLKIHPLDPQWTLPSRLDDNPMVWMLEVNGFIMDMRHAPREVQEVAFQKGLIPYIPADRRPGERGT